MLIYDPNLEDICFEFCTNETIFEQILTKCNYLMFYFQPIFKTISFCRTLAYWHISLKIFANMRGFYLVHLLVLTIPTFTPFTQWQRKPAKLNWAIDCCTLICQSNRSNAFDWLKFSLFR